MKFGIYIRSVGERTERLCLEACRLHVPDKDIQILNGYFPSYNVYREMFKRALKSDYDWYLGLDADVVLNEGWYDLFLSKLKNLSAQNVFKFTFKTYDSIFDDFLDRGNHFYNNKFTPLALAALDKNVIISKLPNLIKNFFNPGYYLKPETSIRVTLHKNYKLENFNYEELIGIHGAEQFYAEVFRTLMVRANRNPEYSKKYLFLEKSNGKQLLDEKKIDRYVANLGWHYGCEKKLKHISAKEIEFIRNILKTDYQIQEKAPLAMTLSDFYSKYRP